MSHEKRLAEIRQELDAIDKKRVALIEERDNLEMARDKERYNCSCVRLNKDLGIDDMIAQEKANRKGLQFGFVYETLSADRGCPKCKGTGIPKKKRG